METKNFYVIVWLYGTWSVADVGHGTTFGGDVAHVDLLGLDLDLLAAGSANECDQQRGLKKKIQTMSFTNVLERWKLLIERDVKHITEREMYGGSSGLL